MPHSVNGHPLRHLGLVGDDGLGGEVYDRLIIKMRPLLIKLRGGKILPAGPHNPLLILVSRASDAHVAGGAPRGAAHA